MLNPTQKTYLMSQEKGEPQQDCRRGKIMFKIMPEILEGLKQTLCAPGPRDSTETEPELCLSVSCGGMGQQWPASGAGALGAAGQGIA